MNGYDRFRWAYRPEQDVEWWWLLGLICGQKAREEGETRTDRKNRIWSLVLGALVFVGAYIGFNALLTAWMMGAW